MDELALFSLALGLAKPWQIIDLKFSKEEGRLDLRLDFVKGAKFPCPSCGETKEGEVHDTLERTWRHLNFFQYETYLHARVPRIRCGKCGVKAFLEDLRSRGSIRTRSTSCAAACGIRT